MAKESEKLPIHPLLLSLIGKVTGKRPLAVINHILKHGQVTTEELKTLYGYNHPPRAARDVRECGIPLVTTRVVSSDGRKIGAYIFGDPSKIEGHKLGGRKVLSKALKLRLLQIQGPHCAITSEKYDPLYLSIDHRIPYEIAGDEVAGEANPEAFMLISAAAQRQKSWACEHCKNWLLDKIASVCKRCYWASPEDYDYIAMEERRRVVLAWIGEEVVNYKKLSEMAKSANMPIEEFIRLKVDKLVK